MWRQRSIVIALALAALAGFFFLGRALSDEAAEPAILPPEGTVRLPSAGELALTGRIPELAESSRERRPEERRPADETPAPAPPETEPPTEPEPVLVESEPPAPAPEEPSPAPAPPAPPEPAPSPPPPESEPEPDGSDGSDETTTFDDSG